MTNRYPFHIEWSEEDEEYVVTCPAFPGLSAFGETEEEALREAKIALAGFIETCQENNISLPEASVRSTVSGKLQLRLPKSLHRIAAQMAELDGVSLNVYIIDAVRAKVATEQFGKQVLNQVRMAVASVLTVRPMSTQYTKTTRQTSIEQTEVMTKGSEGRRDN